jgi:hypothetical protein
MLKDNEYNDSQTKISLKYTDNSINKPFIAILKVLRDMISQFLELGLPYSEIAERLGYTINYIQSIHYFQKYPNIQRLKIPAQLSLLEKFQNLHEEIKESKSLLQ